MYKNHVIATKNELRTSPFGVRTRNGRKEQHNGWDCVCENRIERTSNIDVIAFADGEVVSTAKDFVMGNYVNIAHAGGFLTCYRHLKDNSIKVKQGDTVKAEQPIGLMGTTGDSSGVHLHFAVKVNSSNISNGSYVDPEPYLTGAKSIGSGTQSAPSNTALKVGDMVRILPTADKYVTGETIPIRLKGATDEIMQLSDTSRNPAIRNADAVLLKHIYSWVKKSDVQKI